MTQETLVVLVEGRRAADALSDALTRAGYGLRPAPHARFLAQGEGVTATLYDSGKLVLQGRGLQSWCDRFLPGADLAPAAGRGRELEGVAPGAAVIGSDEAGKGDSFGGLAVCAVAWPEGGADGLVQAGVADSKQLDDRRIRILAPRIRERLACAERFLEPGEYNREHRRAGGNLNRLLAALHAEVVAGLHGRTGIATAVVDRFSPRLPVTAALGSLSPGLEVHEVPRAEAHPAVAAASILARDGFLESLRRLEEAWAVDLPLGSGAPVGPALRRFVEIHGPDRLGEVAKLHFRNVQAMGTGPGRQ